jgi:hypothetical protein
MSSKQGDPKGRHHESFGDPLTTAAAFDRVVHHATIIEFGLDIASYRAEQAKHRLQRPPDAAPPAQPTTVIVDCRY